MKMSRPTRAKALQKRAARAINPVLMSCSLCGSLPDDETVNTGRDHYFQEAFYQLTRLGGGVKEPLRRCPRCRVFFRWIDLPQVYGSGNCDEERAIRLSPNISALLDKLFPDDPKNPPDLGPIDAFLALPLELLVLALECHAFTGPKMIAPFVPRLVQMLNSSNDSSLGAVLSNYRYERPAQAQEILAAFQSLEGAPLSYSARSLKDRCLETIAKKS
jgi:hypothetical protein